jgi:hypothetical protein
MQTLDRSPEVLLDIFSSDFAGVRDEICHIQQALVICPGVVQLYDGTRDNIDVAFFGERNVSVQICLPRCTSSFELLVVGQPIQEMVFGKDSELGTL